MFAFEIPGMRFSLPAGAAVERCRFVSVNSEGNGITATAAIAATDTTAAIAATAVVGASMNKADTGEVLEVADGIVMVEAAGAVTAGVKVASDANGKVVAATDDFCGVALTAATAAGQLVAVKI